MPAAARRRITLAADQAEYIDTLVATGMYASADDVVKAGLEALQDREASLDQWLREEVVPVYDAMQADSARGVSADAVLEAIETHHTARVRAAKRGA